MNSHDLFYRRFTLKSGQLAGKDNLFSLAGSSGGRPITREFLQRRNLAAVAVLESSTCSASAPSSAPFRPACKHS